MDLYGSVIPPCAPLQGCPSALNAEQRNDLFNVLDQAPEMFRDKVQDWMALHHDTAISITSLHWVIQDVGLSLRMLHKPTSERDKMAQEEFRIYVQKHLVAEQVITVDESSKDDCTIF